MKTHAKEFIALLLCFSLVLLFGCVESGNTEANVYPTAQPTQSETAAPEQTPSPDGPYELDRNNVDISKYPEIADAAFEPGEEVAGEALLDTPADNEMKVEMTIRDEEAASITKSGVYSFKFADLPQYDAGAEGSFRFNGSAVSLVISAEESDWCDLPTRNITDEADHAFVIKSIAKRQYVPFEPEAGAWIEGARLIVRIDNDNGIMDTFIVTEDLYVLHFEGEYELDESVAEEQIADVSVEPISTREYLYLAAMASYYIRAEKQIPIPLVFNLYRLGFSGDNPNASKIVLSYRGREKTVTDPETMNEIMLLGQELDTGHASAWQEHGKCDGFGDDAIRISVYRLDAGSGEEVVWEEAFLTEDGVIWWDETLYSYHTKFSAPVSSVASVGNFLYHTDSPMPFDEMLGYLD